MYRELSAMLASRDLDHGDRVDIGVMADRFDVSRPTISHALRLLESDGKVTRYDGVGWVVN